MIDRVKTEVLISRAGLHLKQLLLRESRESCEGSRKSSAETKENRMKVGGGGQTAGIRQPSKQRQRPNSVISVDTSGFIFLLLFLFLFLFFIGRSVCTEAAQEDVEIFDTKPLCSMADFHPFPLRATLLK